MYPLAARARSIRCRVIPAASGVTVPGIRHGQRLDFVAHPVRDRARLRPGHGGTVTVMVLHFS